MKTYTYIVKRAKSRKKQSEKVSFIASTSSPDRYGDVIDQKGWITDNYRKNPVVLLNHDSSQLPIGRGNVSIRNDQLVIDVEFDDEDPRAQEVKRKAQNGFMNAVSVGFRPLESTSRSDLPKDNKYYGQRGMYYSKAELLEVSIVTIPANGEATMLEQKFFNTMKEDLLSEMKSIIQENMNIYKHILEVKEEDDRYIVSFAKIQETEQETEQEEIEEIEEEEIEEAYKEEEEEKEISEESTEDMEEEKKEEEDEKEDKDFNNLIEAFAYILTT
jgi:HK97 family phage prohead protease